MTKTLPDNPLDPLSASTQLKSERIGSRLTGHQIAEQLSTLADWHAVESERAIQRTFELPTFRAAIAFVAYVAELAEAADHHPDIDIRYNKVTVTLTTHSAGGLTDQDFTLAKAIRS